MFVFPSWPWAYIAGARVNQWAYHRKHMTTVTFVLEVLWRNDLASAVNYELFNWMSRDRNYFRILVVLWTKCIPICTFAKVFSMKTIFCINSWKFSPLKVFHSMVYYDLAIITTYRRHTEWVIAYGLKTILHTTKCCHTTPTVYSLVVSNLLALMFLYSHPPQTIINW